MDAIHKTIVVAYLGVLAGQLLPTPSDPIYFRYDRKLNDDLNKNLITPKQYWIRKTVAYYGTDVIWWSIVFGAAMATKGDVRNKLAVVGTIVGIGALIAVLNTNIKEDTAKKTQ